MPYLDLVSSALAPGVFPVRVHYRDAGAGPAIVILHGGWGYEIYPFDRQIAALAATHRIVAPDRTGYGGSGRVVRQETDFHHRAAAETFAVIDALKLASPVVWGHSDGAVIALLMGLSNPGRLGGLILEATHVHRRKPGSREFFETMMRDPDGLGERVTSVLAREHGARWRDLIRTNGDAWLRIANDPAAPADDLYGGRLAELHVPALVIHGARDPRTEPGELEALRDAIGRTHGSAPTGVGEERSASAGADQSATAAVWADRSLAAGVGADRLTSAGADPSTTAGAGPSTTAGAGAARSIIGGAGADRSLAAHVGADLRVGPAVFAILPEGGHSPHSERATADAVTQMVAAFVAQHTGKVAQGFSPAKP